MPDDCACDETKTAVPMADTLCEEYRDNMGVTPINIIPRLHDIQPVFKPVVNPV